MWNVWFVKLLFWSIINALTVTGQEIEPMVDPQIPIDGAWTSWAPFTECTKSCGGGTQEIIRSCANPAPENGGEECYGPVILTKTCNVAGCPVDGNWGEWGEYEECTKSCGGGTKSRKRYCNNPEPVNGGQECEGNDIETVKCGDISCPVDGKWGAWKAKSGCTKTCGGGRQYYERQCNNPKPSSGGKTCSGNNKEIRSCKKQACPVDGNWGAWTANGECTKSCGGGTQNYVRKCNKPEPSFGGKPCSGINKETRPCNKQACPVDGKWGSWKSTGGCTKSCGGGIQNYERECNNPQPSSGGKPCSGNYTETRSCNKQACPVDGKWGSWKATGGCTKSCSGGKQTYTRQCNNPQPSSGGKPCPGNNTETRSCNKQACPVDGQWGSWKTPGGCTKSCGGGKQFYTRQCNNPQPSSGGKPCPGSNKKSRDCNKQTCPVDGGWGSWKPNGRCSKSCGGGIQLLVRQCDNPIPSSGGKPCVGSTRKSSLCSNNPCPVDGGWGSWKPTGGCTRSCGGGIQLFVRECDNPIPSSGGKPCIGSTKKSSLCSNQLCPVDGGWGSWKPTGRCSKSCGGGIQLFMRQCDNPIPSSGGKPCIGTNRKSSLCSNQPCPVDGGWGSWKPTGRCTKSCGGGIQLFVRQCDNPRPSSGGKSCSGISRKSSLCSNQPCPVDGGWGSWVPTGPCSKSCGGGNGNLVRKCNNPKPSSGGKTCSGAGSKTIQCNNHACPVDGGWGSWTPAGTCSKSCGGGTQNFIRKCDNPKPSSGGKSCSGNDRKNEICNKKTCPDLDGQWGSWGSYSTCSRSCGVGYQRRIRYCDNPAPQVGGKFCVGGNTDVQPCNTHPCQNKLDGQWGSWGSFSICSRSCGVGHQRRFRYCDNPAPQAGGKFCVGGNTEVQPCNTHSCQNNVDGQWGSWGSFSICSRSCGVGYQRRFRYCDNPAPQAGGKFCVGGNTEVLPCNTHQCKGGDGNWGPWKPFTSCSASCGGGIQRRTRSCIFPPCFGSNTYIRMCNKHNCPRKGKWGPWKPFTACSASCGGGIQRRIRSCIIPPCVGSNMYIRICNRHLCPDNDK